MLLDAEEQKNMYRKNMFLVIILWRINQKRNRRDHKNQYSERSINDAIHKLVASGEIEIVGSSNSPTVKYK